MRHSILPALLLTAAAACTNQVTDDSTNPSTNTHTSALCPAPTTFAHAVCATEIFQHVGKVSILNGPAGDGSLGVNGFTQLVTDAKIDGALDAYGGLQAVGAAIGGSLSSTEDVQLTGNFTVQGDAQIGGNLSGIGSLTLGGTLGLGGAEQLLGNTSIAARGSYTAPALPCDASNLFDVNAAVAAASTNAQGIDAWTNVGAHEVHLPTGSYYIKSAQLVGTSHIVIDGKVSLFVDGAIQQVGSQQFDLGTTGELDLFVSGAVQSVGDLTAGDASRAGAFRLWAGSNSAIQIVGTGEFYGSIYAPEAIIQHVGALHVVGSLFAADYQGVGDLNVNYAVPGSAPTSCGADPGDPEDPENPSNGTPIVQ